MLFCDILLINSYLSFVITPHCYFYLSNFGYLRLFSRYFKIQDNKVIVKEVSSCTEARCKVDLTAGNHNLCISRYVSK